ncbi:MAG: TIGR00341 family protein [Candidatus Thorarchaeota archaeon]|nr:MAG: TIGR00341 family protein [Candidatus Thorarchaeota archaeon]
MKQVQITVPYEKTEAVLDFIVDTLGVSNVTKLSTDNAHLLHFRSTDDQVSETIEKLKSRGVGVEYGYIDILDLSASLPREVEEVQDTRIQRDATLAVEEIYENVKKQSSLSFDFIAFSILAAAMAGFGLIQNNITVIVASMLLSPLIGPMLGVALGYVVRDKALFFKGTRNELISLGLSFAVGIVMALALPILYPGPPGDFVLGVQNNFNNIPIILTEITRRAGFSPIDIGVAIFSGAAVAVSVTKGDMSSLVGVAISAALMPPAVNAALMMMLGAIYVNISLIEIGIGSLLLLGMNIILIDLAAIVMFRIKKLTPLADRSATWTAVTQFTKTRSESLYHTPRPERAEATFTPAPTTEVGAEEVESVDPEVEKPKKKKKKRPDDKES